MAIVNFTGTNWNTITGYTSPSSFVLAALWEDSGATLPAPNPLVVYGNYSFYALSTTYLVGGDFTKIAPRSAVLFAGLPNTPIVGDIYTITNSTTAVWGANIAGGGANQVLGWWNGTNWTVIGK